MRDDALIGVARSDFHKGLVENGVLSVDGKGVASNADADNKPSREIGRLVANRLGARRGRKLRPQSAGKMFESLVCDFLKTTFPRLKHLRPGTWEILNLGNCVYHFALYELIDAVKEYSRNGREDIVEQLESLIEGKRLKDISDLPLDLAC